MLYNLANKFWTKLNAAVAAPSISATRLNYDTGCDVCHPSNLVGSVKYIGSTVILIPIIFKAHYFVAVYGNIIIVNASTPK
jgi:hypothetical protein